MREFAVIGALVTSLGLALAHRHRGVADTALARATEQIARLGGGTIESYPEDTTDRKVSGSFLHNGTIAMFDRHGFTRSRQVGKHHWVVSRTIR